MKGINGTYYAVAAAFERAGLLDRAAMVADCGLPTQKIFRDLSQLPETVSYFASIIVH